MPLRVGGGGGNMIKKNNNRDANHRAKNLSAKHDTLLYDVRFVESSI